MKVLIVTDKYAMSHDISNGYRVGMAFASLGHEVCFTSPEMASTRAGEADFILGFGSLLYSHRLFLNEWIAKAKKPETKFAIWHFDSCSEIDKTNQMRNKNIKKIIPYLDLLITTDHSYPWENHIGNYLHLYQGIDPEDFKYKPGNNKERPYDVIYTGGINEREPERNRTLKRIGQEFGLVIHTQSKKVRQDGLQKITLKADVYGKEFFNAYQKAKIAFVPRPPSAVKTDYWSNRIYMATATGTSCVVEYVNGLEKEFTAFKEVVYTFDDKDNIDKIRFLLADPELRAKLGRNARKRTLENYKYSDRVKKILEVL